MSRVHWSSRSRRDLRRAFDYYQRVDAGVALRIVDAIDARAEWLVDFPGAGSPIELGLRKMRVAGTRYLILYRERQDGISVSRVHHKAEDWR